MAARLCLLALATLTACAPPLWDATTAAKVVLRSVEVDTAGIKDIKGRMYSVPPQTIDADLTAALQTKLNVQTAGNADVTVVITSVRLVSRVQTFALGGASAIDGVVRVTDVATGRLILAPTHVKAISQRPRLRGMIGAVTAPTAAHDYQQTIAGFAANVAKRLLPY